MKRTRSNGGTNSNKKQKTEGKVLIGIRREDKNRWERRAPLAPTHVEQLVKKGITVLVQPSNLRTYVDKLYEEAGAIIQDDLSECSTIIAVKEVPIPLLLEDKTYVFFSHTCKAQPYNMKLLDTILEKNIRLIDYEKMVDKDSKRVVKFGQFAGYAGMIDMIRSMGDRLLALGYSTPLLHVGFSYCYSSLENAKTAVVEAGKEIESYGLPDVYCPFIVGFTSVGAVSQGALDIFKLLPHEMITPEKMLELLKNPEKGSNKKFYGVIFEAEHMVKRKDNSPFNKAEYYKNPELYESIFYKTYGWGLRVLINCMYWEPRFPRLITIREIQEATDENNVNLLGVCDISCDIGGGVEFLTTSTSIDSPLFVYDPKTNSTFFQQSDEKYMYKEGILMLGVDNLPTEFPKEATNWFGDHLLQYMEEIARSTSTNEKWENQKDLPKEIQSAVVTTNGNLTPPFEYIKELRACNEARSHSILILGAGFVAGPAVNYLCRDPKHIITIADISIEAAQALVQDRDNITAALLNVNDAKDLDSLVSKSNLVISLIPGTLNTIVAESCLRCKKHLVTASYTPPAVQQMNEQVVKDDLIFLNECGLDPGIDHICAVSTIHDIQQQGGKIFGFTSWCGGLPAPEASENPLGYKFSWSPRGVLGAALKSALYLQDGHRVNIDGGDIWQNSQSVDICNGFKLEGVPNRDSIAYGKLYNIEDATTIFRGTLRFSPFSVCMKAMISIGLLEEEKNPLFENNKKISWASALRNLLKCDSEANLKQVFVDKIRTPQGHPFKGFSDSDVATVVDCFEWLQLLDEDKLVDTKPGTYIDALSSLLQEKMGYEPDEKDMVILRHIFDIEWMDGKKETLTSTLVAYGENASKTAMSRTVGTPVGIAAELILEGIIKERGVKQPMSNEICAPILAKLHKEGIKFVEKKTPFH